MKNKPIKKIKKISKLDLESVVSEAVHRGYGTDAFFILGMDKIIDKINEIVNSLNQ